MCMWTIMITTQLTIKEVLFLEKKRRIFVVEYNQCSDMMKLIKLMITLTLQHFKLVSRQEVCLDECIWSFLYLGLPFTETLKKVKKRSELWLGQNVVVYLCRMEWIFYSISFDPPWYLGICVSCNIHQWPLSIPVAFYFPHLFFFPLASWLVVYIWYSWVEHVDKNNHWKNEVVHWRKPGYFRIRRIVLCSYNFEMLWKDL